MIHFFQNESSLIKPFISKRHFRKLVSITMRTRKLRMRFILVILGITAINYSFITNIEKVGVLILAHGSKDQNWNKSVIDAAEPLKKQYAVEVAFGMANPETMQQAIDKLESQSVTRIVVVPLFVSSYSPIIRQNEYLLGLREELADEPMIMDHTSEKLNEHHGQYSHHLMNDEEKNMELRPLNFKSEILLLKPLDDHPFVAEILHARIQELSQRPENETVIIVAHGPNDEEDNENWIKIMDSIADQIRAKQVQEESKKFKQIFCLTIRDDAEEDIYEQAKQHLRTLVFQAAKDGKVIIVPLLLSQGGIEKGIVKRLEGLDYVWNGKTLLPHPNISRFVQTSVENALRER
jgi:sirohydrochlorin ferrochelatase